jgi:hypothetical protein
MPWKTRLFNNMALRNMLRTFGFLSHTQSRKSFTPFFQFKIASYADDYYLHFPRLPYTEQYKNEIFNKLFSYDGFDIIRFLEFHYEAYPEKMNFLRFLKYEATERLIQFKKNSFFPKLQTVIGWVAERMESLDLEISKNIRNDIEQEVHHAIDNNQHQGRIDIPNLVKQITDQFTPKAESIALAAEEKFESLASALRGGQITINNKHHEEKLVDLLLLLAEAQYPLKGPKAERVFKNFSQTDIALLLSVHFGAFKQHRLNTIQKKLGERLEKINRDDPKVAKLAEAIAEYFFLHH